MENHTIWDSLNLKTDTWNLYKELKKQAESLADKTNGILYAEVNPIAANNELTTERGVFYNFYVYAPYLANFRSLLFTVVEEGSKIIVINKINMDDKAVVNDGKSLIDKINGIISSAEVAKLISNLYVTSLEVKKE